MDKDLSFTEWLMTQLDADDPIGDLANDVKGDPSWPTHADTLDELSKYLPLKPWEMRRTLVEAWLVYLIRRPTAPVVQELLDAVSQYALETAYGEYTI